MKIAVLGGGAFGTALAIALSNDGSDVSLWSRDREDAERMQSTRRSGKALSGLDLPQSLVVETEIPRADIYLIAVPSQMVRRFLEDHGDRLASGTVVSCAKGVELGTGLGPVDVIRSVLPSSRAACLTGPSFAIDIARGLPTALVLAMRENAEQVQRALNRPSLRIYRTSDVIGAQLGGALKNIMAIAAGITIGAGLGDSARASVIARGFAEMTRYARRKGAQTETIQGLSGLGDLVLTCTSEKSRNFSAGVQLGQGEFLDGSVTIEGIATAQAVAEEASKLGIEMPLTCAVADVTEAKLDIQAAIETLLSRPAGKE
jgi:glycerol-3-phosphate dehydrogenase (NAD(P)+)